MEVQRTSGPGFRTHIVHITQGIAIGSETVTVDNAHMGPFMFVGGKDTHGGRYIHKESRSCMSHLSSSLQCTLHGQSAWLSVRHSLQLPPGQVFMLWRLQLLLILASGGEQLGTAPKAVVLLQPPWNPVFKGRTVTLLCKGPHSQSLEDTSWYYEATLQGKSETIKIKKTGKYQCKTGGSSLSDPVHVEFSSDWLILQAPYDVFEGDDVELRCLGKEDKIIIERTYYKDGKELARMKNKQLDRFLISRDSVYGCSASGENIFRTWTEHSKSLRIRVQELFSPPKLTASPMNPIEGSPVTLKCETWLTPQRPHTQLQFRFFREGQVLGAGWSRCPEFQTTMRREDSGSYWCEAETTRETFRKQSLHSQVHVQRVAVSDVNLEIRPQSDQIIEGEDLVLICSVAMGTGVIAFSWHREGKGSLGRKTTHSLRAELLVSAVHERDGGRYYCSADNMHGPILSNKMVVSVKVPVSRPILTLRAPRAQTIIGDMVEFHCEVQRGSPPIWYWFYQEDVIVRNSSGLSAGAHFNLSLTAGHSGNYSCAAKNALRAQRSHRVPLNVIVAVSRPVLTVRAPRAQAVVGDVVELLCEAQEGSIPILYQFYHEGVALGTTSTTCARSASFNVSVTAEHSGNYSCEASNGLEPQRSEPVALSVIGSSRNRMGRVTSGGIGGLCSILGLAALVALLFYLWTRRRSRGVATSGMPRPGESLEPSLLGPPTTDSLKPPSSNRQALVELQPMYSNVNPGGSELLYSQILSIQQATENPANSSRMHQEDTEPPVIYSELKKAHPEDTLREAYSRDRDHEDATENYENVPCPSLVSAN
ncbi:Fc receptor-like protein 3 [Tenrec ecaudatus]|uniref:Fc receptor-like protein 3 n=1 Tax=Tenrec ecaudatus TaxID=94439 RepID=UPI003F5A3DA4